MESIIQQAHMRVQEQFVGPKAAQQPFFKQAPRKASVIDEELEELVMHQRAKIRVVGCGGGGNNTINRMTEVGIVGAETVAINTDAQDLLYTNSDHKILIGRELTGGLGAGSIPKVGEESAPEN